MTSQYPKRLIEVDLPIRRISEHARREKSLRHGHISTLHIWWARRPLAACRAVLCAALWPDPADPLCPQPFRDAAATLLTEFARQAVASQGIKAKADPATLGQWIAIHDGRIALDARNANHWNVIRNLLLDFIADYANWDNASVPQYLAASRALTQAAHEALGGQPGTRPLVVDPFAGGGAIPLEALRIGADAFASDLNPVAVLLNKVVLEYIPKYGQRLAGEVRKWGGWVKERAEQELAEFYPKDPDGATPIAYLWARTVTCEGPGCGAEIPLLRSPWLARKPGTNTVLRIVPDPARRRVDFEIVHNAKAKDIGEGTVKKGAATCPLCGFTTPVASVRRQLITRHGGAVDARLLCVVTMLNGGRQYRLPIEQDMAATQRAAETLGIWQQGSEDPAVNPFAPLSPLPDEPLDLRGIRHTWVMIYGISSWGDLFTPRQALLLSLLALKGSEASAHIAAQHDPGLAQAVQTCLALAVSRQCDYSSSLCSWHASRELIRNTFGRQALPMVWDFTEGVPLAGGSGSFSGAVDWVAQVCATNSILLNQGQVENVSATCHPLPDDAANAYVTDPPYYDAIPYAYLSDFFYVWLRRMLGNVHPDLFRAEGVPKDAEIVVDRKHELSTSTKDIAFYERELTRAFAEGRRILAPDGIGTIVFASKTTSSWEAILQGVIKAGWIITGSWPIDTEMEAKVAAIGQARLMSSVHLVCRPRDKSEHFELVGDWRDVLQELPRRIHEWMPRLAAEGVVGADAIFACLGPALEIFSRYSRVEKASGEVVSLRDYLEQVWATVAREALGLIFSDVDATGFEEDARLTAMWLWTLSTAVGQPDLGSRVTVAMNESHDDDEEEEEETGKKRRTGLFLEYDAVRKIAQGLGANLEHLEHLVEVKGNTARLLPVSERTRHLFGKEEAEAPTHSRVKRPAQLSLDMLDMLDELQRTAETGDGWGRKGVPQPGTTVLDRVHQAMILFAAGRTEALRRFIVDESAGSDVRFWRLAQALSALYPAQTDEKRWVDGVLARKKGLGF